MKFPTEHIVPLDRVRKLICHNSAAAFQNKYFVNISQDTLVDLLSMDALNIKEIDVLKSCGKWIDEEIKRQNLELNQTNKQMVFEPIKNFIKFSEITFDELRRFYSIKDLLSSDELSSLFLHHLNISKFKVECNTKRMRLELRSANCNNVSNHPVVLNHGYTPIMATQQRNYSEFSLVFKTSKSIVITSIYTFLPITVRGLELSIYDMANVKVEFQYVMKYSQPDNLCYFQFTDSVAIDSTRDYRFVFKFQSTKIMHTQLSRDTTMIQWVKDVSLLFNLTSSVNQGYHCLNKIDFYSIS